jgi:hypothetical protein
MKKDTKEYTIVTIAIVGVAVFSILLKQIINL